MRPACSLRGFRLPAFARATAGRRSFVRRWQAGVLLLTLLLSACAATTGRTADDLTTTTEVKIALLNDARIGGLRLAGKTFPGRVPLSGAASPDRRLPPASAAAPPG